MTTPGGGDGRSVQRDGHEIGSVKKIEQESEEFSTAFEARGLLTLFPIPMRREIPLLLVHLHPLLLPSPPKSLALDLDQLFLDKGLAGAIGSGGT